MIDPKLGEGLEKAQLSLQCYVLAMGQENKQIEPAVDLVGGVVNITFDPLYEVSISESVVMLLTITMP